MLWSKMNKQESMCVLIETFYIDTWAKYKTYYITQKQKTPIFVILGH